jgi:hypothetical protein
MAEALPFVVERVPLTELREHPRNYQRHPDDQLAQIEASIRQHGFYRNVIIAREGTILAGHGVVETLRRMGERDVPVRRLEVEPDSPEALKVLVSDNEINNLAEVDDRALTELLRTIQEDDPLGLLGSGFTEEQLAALALASRTRAELADYSVAAEWVGLPAFDPEGRPPQVVVSFLDEADRERFMELIGAPRTTTRLGNTWSIHWPQREVEDLSSLKFQEPAGA